LLDSKNAWIQFNAVDFGSSKPKSVQIKAASGTGGMVQIRLNHLNGPLVSQVKIPEETGWDVIKTKVLTFLPGIHNLIVISADDKPVEIDWIRFTE